MTEPAGPEELIDKAARVSLMLRAMARRTRRFRLLMNVNYREVCDAKDSIDHLAWLHAEAAWRRDELIAQFHTMRGVAVERRCRIDKALALLDPGAIGNGEAFTRDEDIAHFNAVRAALQPDKPEADHG